MLLCLRTRKYRITSYNVCYTKLLRSATKTSGTIEEAIAAGKNDPCDNCLSEIKDLNKEDIQELTTTNDAAAITEDTTDETATEEAPAE